MTKIKWIINRKRKSVAGLKFWVTGGKRSEWVYKKKKCSGRRSGKILHWPDIRNEEEWGCLGLSVLQVEFLLSQTYCPPVLLISEWISVLAQRKYSLIVFRVTVWMNRGKIWPKPPRGPASQSVLHSPTRSAQQMSSRSSLSPSWSLGKSSGPPS